jgi:Flp pilus assembly pilin Flp
MIHTLAQLWREDDGVLSFEWTLIAVLVVFGIVGGLAAARDVIIDELGDLAEGVAGFNQSFSFTGIPALGIPDVSYNDLPSTVSDCGRNSNFGIAGRDDSTDGA